jgi:hypothetical protein
MGLLGTGISVGLRYLNELMFVWGAVLRMMKHVVGSPVHGPLARSAGASSPASPATAGDSAASADGENARAEQTLSTKVSRDTTSVPLFPHIARGEIDPNKAWSHAAVSRALAGRVHAELGEDTPLTFHSARQSFLDHAATSKGHRRPNPP